MRQPSCCRPPPRGSAACCWCRACSCGCSLHKNDSQRVAGASVAAERRRQAAAAAGAGAGGPATAGRRGAHLGKADRAVCVRWAVAWPPSVAGELRASGIASSAPRIPPSARSKDLHDHQLSRQRLCAGPRRHRRGALVQRPPALWCAEPCLQTRSARTNMEDSRSASACMAGCGAAALRIQPPLPPPPVVRHD